MGQSPEESYVEAFFVRQRLLWENYADGAGHNLADVDHSLFTASQSLLAQNDGDADPHGPLLRRVATRGTVDFHPSVAVLRNRLDDRDNYSTDDSSTSELAAAMEPDVLALMARRNELSRNAGFAGYGRLALWSERQDYEAVVRFVTDELGAVMKNASKLVIEEGFTTGTWFEGLARMAGAATVDPIFACRRLASIVGLDDLASHLTWVVADQPISGVAGAISVPDDIRILLRDQDSSGGTVVAFHELGHALAHTGNRGSGIHRTWDVVTDETMASIMELIGVELQLNPEQRRVERRAGTLETARMATSFLFEIAVNENPADARQLYRDYYEPLVPVEDPVLWAVDSFRSIDPFHIHSYLIGARVAEATLAYLIEAHGDDPRRWGPWLAANLFADGRRRTIIEKLKAAGIGISPRLRSLMPSRF